MLFTTLSTERVPGKYNKMPKAQGQGRIKWLIIKNQESEKRQNKAKQEMEEVIIVLIFEASENRNIT